MAEVSRQEAARRDLQLDTSRLHAQAQATIERLKKELEHVEAMVPSEAQRVELEAKVMEISCFSATEAGCFAGVFGQTKCVLITL